MQLNQALCEKGVRVKADGSIEIDRNIPGAPYLLQVKRRGEGKGWGEGSGTALPDGSELKLLVEEYTTVYTKYLVSDSPQLKEEVVKLEKQLSDLMPHHQLLELQVRIKNNIRQMIAEAGKEKLLGRVMSKEKGIETFSNEAAAHRVFGFAANNPKLGGADFGNYHEGIQGTADTMAQEASREVKTFLSEELENAVVRRILTKDKTVEEYVDKLMKVASRAGFDTKEWALNVLPGRKRDLGLTLIEVPASGVGILVNTSTDNPNQNNNQAKHGYEFVSEDEKEIMVNRLRAAYMQQILKGDFRSQLSAAFKMRKLKNGLYRLGIYTEELDAKVKQEAEIVAKMKLLDMLKEALLERATLYDLAGPAHALIERKIKGVLKNAERIGLQIGTSEFDSLRDSMNQRVYAISKREVEIVRSAQQINKSPQLAKKEQLLLKVLARLKEESGIYDDQIAEIPTDMSQFVSEAA
jgi:hypothetical protein